MTLLQEITDAVNTDGAANTTWKYRKELVLSDETINTGRWEERVLSVVQRGYDSVGIEYSVGLTEYQDAEEEPEVYLVKPVVVQVTKWVKA